MSPAGGFKNRRAEVQAERRRARPPLSGRRVVLGVCGSIAAYKACELVRSLKERGAEVRVVMTPTASQFVSPMTLGVLSGAPPLERMQDPALWHMAHLDLADWADAVVVAPATADFIARAAAGRCEELLDGLLLATRARVALCPAMDGGMWLHPATRANAERAASFGYEIWGPEQGPLASGKLGWGRLLEPEAIVSRLESLLVSKNASRKTPVK